MFSQRASAVWALGICLLVSFALFSGCGEDEGNGLPTKEVAAGWSAYLQGDYDSAISSFRAAVSKEPTWGEPYNGLGWCYAGQENLDQAMEEFDLAVTKSPKLTDAWAGKALVSLTLHEYLEAGNAARQALTLGQDKYHFRYNEEVNARSLRLILAESAFYLGDYATAEQQVELVDLETILDPADADYLDQLLTAIGRLSRM
jgi:tetratricopeptide (TPR) repeat protein